VYDSTDKSLVNKTSQRLITTNNSLLTYTINGFPYNTNPMNYKIKFSVRGIGGNAQNFIFIGAESDSFEVKPGLGVEYVTNRENTNILLANFDAKDNNNNSLNPYIWTSNNGEEKDNWKFLLHSLSATIPDPDYTGDIDDLGSGWKSKQIQEIEDTTIYNLNYLHLKHNAYGVLVDS
jgi:hypothetical protein